MENLLELPPPTLRLQFEKALLWILRSPFRVMTAVVSFGAAASFLECTIHLAVRTSIAMPLVQALADSLILGIGAALFGLLVLAAVRDRNHKVQNDLRRIADLNHQVRNSLQIIVYGEHSPDIAQHRSAVLVGVEQIESTLRELFPLVGERTDNRPWEAHNQLRLQGHQFRIECRRQSN
jgi:hypothetical protein